MQWRLHKKALVRLESLSQPWSVLFKPGDLTHCFFRWTSIGLSTARFLFLNMYLVVFTPFLPNECSTDGAVIQIYTANQIEIRLRENGRSFRTSHQCKFQTGKFHNQRADCHRWLPKSCLLSHINEHFTVLSREARTLKRGSSLKAMVCLCLTLYPCFLMGLL